MLALGALAAIAIGMLLLFFRSAQNEGEGVVTEPGAISGGSGSSDEIEEVRDMVASYGAYLINYGSGESEVPAEDRDKLSDIIAARDRLIQDAPDIVLDFIKGGVVFDDLHENSEYSDGIAEYGKKIFAEKWLSEHPEQTRELTEYFSDEFKHIVAFPGAVRLLSDDPDEALAIVSEFDGVGRNSGYEKLIYEAVGSKDIKLAKYIVEKVADAEERLPLISVVGWALGREGANGLGDAVEWVSELEGEAERAAVAVAFAGDFKFPDDPDQKRRLVAGVEEPFLRMSLLEFLADQKTDDVTQALDWANSGALSDEEAAFYRKTIVSKWARHDLEAATRGVDALEDPELRGVGIASVVDELDLGPNQAEWIMNLAYEENRIDAVYNYVGRWLQEDAIAVSQWAASLPIGLERDWAAFRVADYLLGEREYEEANKWIEEVQDAKLRRRLEVSMIKGL